MKKEKHISFLPNIKESERLFIASVDEILSRIRSGEWKNKIDFVRSELVTSRDRYNKAKSTLPAVTFNGKFKGSRKNDNLELHSGFIIIDIDHIGNVQSYKDILSADPFTYAVFVSPSGEGLKVLFRTSLLIKNDAEHKEVFRAVEQYFKREYRIEIDQSGKDVSRLCFVSYDPDLFINPESIPFNKTIKPGRIKKADIHTAPIVKTDNPALVQRCLDIVQKAPDGSRHALRLKAGRLLGGYIAGGQVSEIHAETLIQSALANTTQSEYKIRKDISGAIENGKKDPIYPQNIKAGKFQAMKDRYRQESRPEGNIDNTIEFSSRYIDQYLPAIPETRLTLLESTTGTGKTARVDDHIGKHRTNQTFIVITHRRRLAEQLALKFGFTLYLDAVNLRDAVGNIVIQVDSLYQLDMTRYRNAVIILDEIDQLFAYVLNSDTMKKKRTEILTAFYFLLKESRQIIGLSADIPSYIVKFIQKNAAINESETVFYRNTFRPADMTGQMYFYKETLYQSMIDDLREGKKVPGFFTSKKEAEKIFYLLRKKFPEKKGLLITADTGNFTEIQKALRDPQKLQEYDFIIYSPAIYSGQDFNIEFSDSMYLVANTFDLSAKDLFQGRGRFRKCKNLKYFVQLRDGKAKTDSAEILRTEKERLLKSGVNIYSTIPILEAFSELNTFILADRNAEINSLAVSFTERLIQEGYTLENPNCIKGEDLLKELIREIENEIKQERIIKTKEAKTISEAEYKRIKREGAKSDTEYFQKARFEFIRTTRDENLISDCIDYAVRPESMRSAVSIHDILIRTPDETRKRDAERTTNFLHDNRYEGKIKQIVSDILGIFHNQTVTSRKSYLLAMERLTTYVRDNQFEIENYLRINPHFNKKGNIDGYFLRELAKILGYKLDKSGKNGKHWFNFNTDLISLWDKIRANRRKYLSGNDEIIFIQSKTDHSPVIQCIPQKHPEGLLFDPQEVAG